MATISRMTNPTIVERALMEHTMWVRKPLGRDQIWRVAQILKADAKRGEVEVKMEDTGEVVRGIKASDLLGFDTAHNLDWDDVMKMSDLNEAALLKVLRSRFKNKKICTFLGDILVCINPYEKLTNQFSLESPSNEAFERFREFDNKPHLLVMAVRAYKRMRSGYKAQSQSILINGESGAGKTEAAKYVMRCLAHQSNMRRLEVKKEKADALSGKLSGMGVSGSGPSTLGRGTRGGTKKRGRGGLRNLLSEKPKSQTSDIGSHVERCALQSNPLLEAFGNARTVRNRNSSRFGKFIQVRFDKEGCICAATTRHFLLEKSRVASHSLGERNFHIFYQVQLALREGKLESSVDWDAGTWEYLTPERFLTHETDLGVDDSQEDAFQDRAGFEETLEAMEVVGLSVEDRQNVWRVLEIILLLGQLKFEENDEENTSNMEGSQIVNSSEMDKTMNQIQSSLGVKREALAHALCFRTVKAGTRSSIVTVPMSKREAHESRDGLAKALYSALFDWIVYKINFSTRLPPTSARTSRNPVFIGVLDIFGFEVLKVNSFEQLCINYANEVLQSRFDDHIFSLEKQMYENEGVDWSFLSFQDNLQILTLLDNKAPPGVFQLLDEQGLLKTRGNRATDEGYLRALNKQYLPSSTLFTDASTDENLAFQIKHFAGAVVYKVEGFLKKNTDALQPDLAELVLQRESVDDFVYTLFALSASNSDKASTSHRSKSNRTKSENTVNKRMSPSRSGLPSRNFQDVAQMRKMANLATVSSTFREQMTELFQLMELGGRFFIRCIKPNHLKAPSTWDAQLVLHQLSYLSLMEMIRIRKEGYPVQRPFADFAEMFHTLLPGGGATPENHREACELILTNALGKGKGKGKGKGNTEQAWQCGHHKLFLKDKILEKMSQKIQDLHDDNTLHTLKQDRRTRQNHAEKARHTAGLKVTRFAKRVVSSARKHRRKDRAIKLMQKVARGALVRSALKTEEHRESVGALRLQTWARALHVRRRFLNLLNTRRKWKPHLLPNEAVVMTSLVTVRKEKEKEKTKTRQLVFTSGPQPRLICVNLKTGSKKEVFKWNPGLFVLATSETDFVVASQKKKISFTDKKSPAICWVVALPLSLSVVDLVSKNYHLGLEPRKPVNGEKEAVMQLQSWVDPAKWDYRRFVLHNHLLVWHPQDSNLNTNPPEGALTVTPALQSSMLPQDQDENQQTLELRHDAFPNNAVLIRCSSTNTCINWLDWLSPSEKEKDKEKGGETLTPAQEPKNISVNQAIGIVEEMKNQGNKLFRASSVQSALDAYSSAIEEARKVCPLLNLDPSLVQAKVRARKLEQNVVYLLQAVSTCLNNRAACFHKLKQYAHVVKDSSWVLELGGPNAKAFLRRGLAKEHLGMKKGALKDVKKAIALNPNMPTALKAMQRLDRPRKK